MFQKTRFASVPTFYSPDMGPLRLPGPSPYRFSSKPVASSMSSRSKPRVNPLLAPSYPLAINYNIISPPSTVSTPLSRLSARALAQPAVTPPLPFITLISPLMSWEIRVPAAANGAYVTVADVLEATYRSLRIPVSSADFHALRPDMQTRASAAFESRCSGLHRSRDGYLHERRKGMKRIDLLAERTRFQGLSSTSHGPNVWTINLT